MKIQELLNEINCPHANINATLHDIRKLMLEHSADHLPVIDDNGDIFGVIDSKIIAESHISASSEFAQNIWEMCERDFETIHPDASIEETIKAFHSAECGFLVVAVGRRYIGGITSDQLLSKVNISSESAEGADAGFGNQ